MKKTILYLVSISFILFLINSCSTNVGNRNEIIPQYYITIDSTINKNAPALQSFSQGVSGDEWLLFAGRTNSIKTYEGGLHNLDSNYKNTSFIPLSFNDSIFVYNPILDNKPIKIHYNTLVEKISEECFEKIGELTIPCIKLRSFLNENLSIFRNTNALVKQDGDFLYVVGGYGAIMDSLNTANYKTFNHVSKINVPNMIKLIKGENLPLYDVKNIISVGKNEKLISTGGELYILNNTFYLSGGHNFGGKAANGQKYVDAVYPFTLETFDDDENSYILNVIVDTPISDVPNPQASGTDATSIFRRRDGPITPNLYKVNSTIKPGLTFYAGVFRPDSIVINNKDTTSYHLAWNNAIYVHPEKNVGSKKYTYDSSYNQKNFNVYSCPNFVFFDTKSEILHTFLLGGIGDGERAKIGHLSGFTNTGVHIKMNIGDESLRSSHEVLSYDIFKKGQNKPPFYGAEGILFPNKNLTYSEFSEEIIDINKSISNENKSIFVGYIYGGIEAFESNPGTYGQGKSRASNRIWKVTLTKQSLD